MKIVHVINSLALGGSEALLSKLIINDNNQHIVVSLKKNSSGIIDLFMDNQVKVIELNFGGKYFNLTKIINLIKIFSIEKPDIVQSWHYHSDLIAGICAKLSGVKTIIWIIVAFNIDRNLTKFSTSIIIKINSFLSFFIPTKIVLVADSCASVHKKIGFKQKKFTTINIGFLPPFKKKIKIETLINQYKKNNFIIGMVARWNIQKDHFNLFRALQLLDTKKIPYKCILIGRDIDYKNIGLRKQIADTYINKDNLVLLGEVEDVNNFMKDFDVHVLSSLGEAFPNVIGEAMICGTPCIGTDVGDMSFIIGDTGWIVPPSKPKELGKAILEAYEVNKNKESWNDLKTKCVDRINNNFSIKSMVKDYNNLWSDLSLSSLESKVIKNFGQEWNIFDHKNVFHHNKLKKKEFFHLFNNYFNIFPKKYLNSEKIGLDVGCGSGRWAVFIAPKVKNLYCLDPSNAIEIAKKNLNNNNNCFFFKKTIEAMNFSDNFFDFGYSLGVIHHMESPQKALNKCVQKIKVGSPFLLYIYYAFDGKPLWFRMIWYFSDFVRAIISRIPVLILKLFFTNLIAFIIYWPLSRLSKILERRGFSVLNVPLSYYRDSSIYTMKTDCFDRFSTRIEKRFTKDQVYNLMKNANLEKITFSDKSPYWVSVGFKKSLN